MMVAINYDNLICVQANPQLRAVKLDMLVYTWPTLAHAGDEGGYGHSF